MRRMSQTEWNAKFIKYPVSVYSQSACYFPPPSHIIHRKKEKKKPRPFQRPTTREDFFFFKLNMYKNKADSSSIRCACERSWVFSRCAASHQGTPGRRCSRSCWCQTRWRCCTGPPLTRGPRTRAAPSWSPPSTGSLSASGRASGSCVGGSSSAWSAENTEGFGG